MYKSPDPHHPEPPLSVSPWLSLCVSVSVSPSLCLSLCVSVSLSPSLCLPLSVSLSLSLALCLSPCLQAREEPKIMDLSDALGGEGGMWPGGGSNQPGGPTNPTWPGGAPAQGPWPGPGGATPSAQSVSMKVPYDQTLPNGVFDKLLITINGTMKPDAKAVTMNISTSHDIAFHFTVRFNEDGKKVIVRNSEISNKWGQEERDGPFPFVPGQPFEMKVLCTSQAFRVAVNGSHLLEFRHRVKDLKSITRLSLYKDLTLTSVLVDRVP